jgi:hypothetical protein
MSRAHMSTKDTTSKQNKPANSNKTKGVETRTDRKVIETRKCRYPTKHERTQTHVTGNRQKALITSRRRRGQEAA